MNILYNFFDASLAICLLLLAWKSVTATDLAKSIVLFIIFGLLVALTWSRLGAVDVALAEAAIGSGMTGALLLSTLRRINESEPKDE